ncbi:MAG: tetratricopeptide repeat protein [Salinivirgaceae bacterium]|nr:tetratricopeptide repeat protein [Salinivirgaceae bacterium]
MSNFSRIILSVSAAAAAAVLVCCAPTKNTPLRRAYHNTTSKYNVYFNGNEAFKSGMENIYSAHDENFALILPMFVYSDKEAALTSYGDMNRVIEKSEKCVRKHSITVKPNQKKGKKLSDKQKSFMNKYEYVKWIDDAEMLNGKALTVKQDYYAAVEQFTSIVRQYDDQDTKTEAYIWLARCYTEMEKYDQAQDFLNTITGDMSKVSKKMMSPLNATQADIMIRQERYTDAIPYLEDAIKTIRRNKRDKVRMMYILAQLYQLNEESRKASEWYQKVIDKNPDYKYTFNASINKASIYNSETGNSDQLQRVLNKMLKDEKNTEYLDQIYYALGNIAYNEMRDDDALWYYKQSIATSTVNTNQKSVSYLAVADIYFDKPDYRKAQLYYDSAMVNLPREYPNYKLIKRKTDNLTDLVRCLETISREDSLQKLAKMSEAERNRIIDQKINAVKAEEEAAKSREAEAKNDLAQAQQMSRQNSNTGGKWYFYNQSSLSLGQSEFSKKWGGRKLEDNWRRSNKTVLDFDDYDAYGNEEPEEDKKKDLDNKTREYYLVDIPLTDSAYQVSEAKEEAAYFDLGVIYKDKFADLSLSISAFEDYLKKYPNSEQTVSALFNMYKVYLLQKDYPNAEACKNRIINDYPDTDYAKILNNPDYYKELERADNQLNFMYQATYKFFISGDCDQVTNTYNYVDSAYPESRLIPKFALLSTLCSGKNTDTATFEQALKAFIAKYPKNEESTYAREVIAALNRKPHVYEEKTEEELLREQLAAEQLAYDTLDITLFNYNAAETYYYMVACVNSKLDDNKIKFNLIDFNDEYFDFLNFDVSNQRLNEDYNVVIVTKFKNAKMAQNYIESVIIAGEVFDDITPDSYKHYIISKSNYDKLLEDKNIDRYNKFFEQNFRLNP